MNPNSPQTSGDTIPNRSDSGHVPGRNSGGRRPAVNPLLVFAGAALVALLVYLPTVKYDFVWDDGLLIQKNSFLDQTNPVELFTKGFWYNPEMNSDQGEMAYYRPLTNLSFFLERKEWGVRPAGYHLTNVVINAVVVFLLCLLLYELFGSVWLAALGGLLVGVHPAMNCVVTFISNRTYLLAMVFLLLSFYALLRGEATSRKPGPPPAKCLGQPLVSRNETGAVPRLVFAGSFLLSLLALESALVFAAIAAGWLVVNRASYRSLRVWLVLTVLPVVIYFILRLGIAHVAFASSVVRWAIEDPLKVINTFGQQMQLLVFPFNHKVIYVAGGALTGFSIYTVLGILFLGLPLYAVIRLRNSTQRHRDTENPELTAKTSRTPRESNPENAPPRTPRPQGESNPESTRRHKDTKGERPKDRNNEIPKESGSSYAYRLPPTAYRLAWLGYAWIVLFLLPFAHLVFLGPAGRMLYLTAPGLLILSLVLYQATSRKPQATSQKPQTASHKPQATRVVYAAIVLYTALFAVQTLRRNPMWRNEFELYQAMVREAPESAGAHLNFGTSLAEAGRKTEAIDQYRAAIELNPDYIGPHDQLAFALLDQGDLPGATSEMREVVRLEPGSADAHNNLALALKRSGQLDSAIAEYQAALHLNPNSELALNNLGSAYLARGDFQSAIAAFRAALRVQPDFDAARKNLAQVFREAGMPDSAAAVEK
jgi:tetratricopeptide (TPR) repeat protein